MPFQSIPDLTRDNNPVPNPTDSTLLLPTTTLTHLVLPHSRPPKGKSPYHTTLTAPATCTHHTPTLHPQGIRANNQSSPPCATPPVFPPQQPSACLAQPSTPSQLPP
ncbi:hypothetical protein XPA_001372 [Xanthoria parietina]